LLDGTLGWVVAAEPSGVVDVEDWDVALDSVDEVPVDVDVEVDVEVVEDAPVVAEVLLSFGAVGLTPPLPGMVEMPPVARTLILTGVVVVTRVEVGADAPGLLVALAASPLAAAAGDWVCATSDAAGTLGPRSLGSTVGKVMR
jgi:hypothetical protein